MAGSGNGLVPFYCQSDPLLKSVSHFPICLLYSLYGAADVKNATRVAANGWKWSQGSCWRGRGSPSLAWWRRTRTTPTRTVYGTLSWRYPSSVCYRPNNADIAATSVSSHQTLHTAYGISVHHVCCCPNNGDIAATSVSSHQTLHTAYGISVHHVRCCPNIADIAATSWVVMKHYRQRMASLSIMSAAVPTSQI